MKLFQEMPEKGLMPDAITYSSVISALAKGKQWALALKVRKGGKLKQFHEHQLR